MGLQAFEMGLTYEAREVLENKKLRLKDLQEWSSADIKKRDDEIVVYLPRNKMFVAYKKEADKRKPTQSIDPSKF